MNKLYKLHKQIKIEARLFDRPSDDMLIIFRKRVFRWETSPSALGRSISILNTKGCVLR